MSRDIGKTPAVHSISETCSGSLQEKNGVWYTVISYKLDGNRKNKWETTHLSGRKNKKTADILLQERMEEFNRLATQKNDETFHHIRVIPRVTLFSDYLELWMQMQEPNVAYNTALSRKQMLKARIRPFFDARKITLASLSAMDVEEFYISLRKANLTGSSMIHYHQLMNQALEAAVKKDLIEKNPMKKVDRPHKNQFVGTFYNREEIDALLNAFINDPLYGEKELGQFKWQWELRLANYPGQLSMKDIAEITGYNRETIRRWVSDGRIAYVEVGKKYIISKDELRSFLRCKFFGNITRKSAVHLRLVAYSCANAYKQEKGSEN